MDVVEQYNETLKRLEAQTIEDLNKALDASFNRIVRKIRFNFSRKDPDVAAQIQRDLSLLIELRQLVPAYSPESVDRYDRIFENLARQAQFNGVAIAKELSNNMYPGDPRLDVSIPFDAVAAATRSKNYLRKHSEVFATTASQLIAQGITEGRSTEKIVRDMKDRLEVTKHRARVIVRTESLRAYNEASNTYYRKINIDQVMFYATSDDRTCPWCRSRAGNIYDINDVRTPLHPQCRCYLAPWDPELADRDSSFADMRNQHIKEIKNLDPIDLSEGLKTPATFESVIPTPKTP